MNNLYEALEICLQDIEQGADIETVLFRYPDLADELRPILEASVNAKALAVPAPSADAVRRNRAKLLQHAAQMREGKVKPSAGRFWFASLRRVAVTLVVVAALFVSGTSLVRAASTTVPGDNLYPVKRTWEDVLVLLAFNSQVREALEFEHENERLEELNELFAEGRSEEVDFAGYVTRQSGTEWRVSGITVMISAQTRMPDELVAVGAPVRVRGQTQGDKIVLAERIELLSAGAKLPEVEDDEPEIEEENHEGPNQQNEDNSGQGSEGDAQNIEDTNSSGSESEVRKESFEGTVNSMENDVWTVDGASMDVSSAEIKGTPAVGAAVKVEGYTNSAGVFVVTRIEFEQSDSGGDNGSGSDEDKNENDSSGDENSNDHDDDDENKNDHDNDNNNDNGNENSNGSGDD